MSFKTNQQENISPNSKKMLQQPNDSKGFQILVNGEIKQPMYPYPLPCLNDSTHDKKGWSKLANIVLEIDKMTPLVGIMRRHKFEHITTEKILTKFTHGQKIHEEVEQLGSYNEYVLFKGCSKDKLYAKKFRQQVHEKKVILSSLGKKLREKF